MEQTPKRPLHAWRDGRELSQAQAAKLAGITQPHWCRIERGEMFASPEVALRIDQLTGISKDSLMNFGDSEPVGSKRR